MILELAQLVPACVTLPPRVIASEPRLRGISYVLAGGRKATHHRLGEQRLDDVAVDVGEAEMAALEFIGETEVIDAEAMENGGVEVVDIHGVTGDVVAEVVGFTVGEAGFDAAAGEPEGEATGMVIAPVIDFGESAL